MYQVITNFQGGLDARKYILSLPPGTLTQLVNAHISQGAEIEKRKRFVPTVLPANTFGMQETPGGLLVFGSIAAPVITQPTGTTVSYQRLQHPDGVTAMNAVVWSTLFGNFAWVIASFADGSVYEYYNGVIIGDFRNGGRAIDFTSNVTIAASLAAMVNADGTYTAAQIGATNQFNVTAAAGSNFTVADTLVSAAGTLTSQLINTAIPGTAGAAAQGSFQIVAGVPAFATGLIDTNGQPADGNTVTINGVVYTFKTVLGAAAGNVLIDTTATLTLTNLMNCIIGGPGAGTKYVNTAVHPNASVTCAAPVVGSGSHVSVTVTAKASGTAGNYNVSAVGANLTVPATLTGGNANGITQITVATGTNLLAAAVDFVADVPTFAAAIAAAINGNASGYTASANGGLITIFAATGVAHNGEQVSVTSKGTVCIGNCQFIVAGTGFTLNPLAVNGTSIISGALTFPQVGGQTINQFMAAVVANINTQTGSTGYLACFLNNIIFVSKTVTTSTDAPLTLTGTVTPVGGGSGSISAPGNTVILASVNLTSLPLVRTGGSGAFATYKTAQPITVTVSGGIAPYTYQWTFTDANTGGIPKINFSADSAGATTNFSGGGQNSQTVAVNAVCKVTDYVGNFSTTPAVLLYKN